jgi:two-component system sensor histidine kinase DegS
MSKTSQMLEKAGGAQQPPSWRKHLLWLLKQRHFWVIVTIITCGTIIYYANSIPVINSVESSLRIDFARRSVHRILSILPVAYAAFVFGLPGGLVTTAVISVLLLPRVFLVASEAQEALIEVAAFAFIGTFVSWLIELQNREKAQHGKTIASLEWTQGELRAHIEAVENEERRLSAINAVLSAVAESLELPEILNLAMSRVRSAMGVDKSLLFLLNEETGELTLEAHHGVSAEFAAEVETLKVGEGLNGRVAETGEPLVVKDGSASPALQRGAGAKENMRAQLIVPLKSKGRVMGTLCAATSERRDFVAEEVKLASAIGNAIGVAIENARLYQKERKTSEELRQSEENYRGLFENATEAILLHALDGKIIGANQACEELCGYSREELAKMDITDFLAGESLETVREIVRKLLAGEATRGAYELRMTKRDGTEATVEIMPSLIVRGGEPLGVQVIMRDVTEQRRMQENLRFYVSQVLKAQESERLRIARELHDDTAQALTGISRRLDMLASGGTEMSPEVAERLDELREQTDSALDGVRRFSQDLRPPVLDDLGLLPALKWLAIALEEQDGIGANIRMLGEPRRLPRDTELALFRIAQEALSNVRKHARASAVELMVDFRDGHIKLVVADNGSGFDLQRSASDVSAGKLGLIGMQERARLLGGTIDIQSAPGEGTSVVVTVPG